MNRRTVSLTLAVLFLATLLISPSAAQTEADEVEITVQRDGWHYTVTTAQTVVLRSGWGACTPGLVRAYINGSNYQVTLDGTPFLAPEEIDQLWGPLQPAYYETCKRPETSASAEWRYVWGQLPVGTYELYSTLWSDHPIPDGGDYDGDGRPDVVAWSWEATVTIEVIPAD